MRRAAFTSEVIRWYSETDLLNSVRVREITVAQMQIDANEGVQRIFRARER